MTNFSELPALSSGVLVPVADPLRLAVAAYLARFKGSSRDHTDSDLRCYLCWCADRDLDPLAARRPHLELYIRWMQEVRRFGPSTVSRRFSVAAGFYRTCVIDGVLEHSTAGYVRRPAVPAESPTLGYTHLQFEALLTAARQSANDYGFALVAMLGLLGLGPEGRPSMEGRDALVRGRARVRASALKDLTPRELDVLREMAAGRGNAGIAAHLHLSESSAEKHVNAIFTKLGLTTEDLSHRRVTAVLTFLRGAGLRG